MNSKKFLKGTALAIILSFVFTFTPQSAFAVEKQEQNQISINGLLKKDTKQNNTNEKLDEDDKEQSVESKDNSAKTDKNKEEKKLESKSPNNEKNGENKDEKERKDKKNNVNIKSKEETLQNNSQDGEENKSKEKASLLGNKTKKELPGIIVSKNLVSLTEVREVEVKATFNKPIELKNIIWTYGGKSFDQWKKWNKDQNKFSAEPFISFVKAPEVKDNTVTAIIKFDLPYGTDNLASYRSKFHELLGVYDLAVKDSASGEELKQAIRLNVYDSYRKYNELKPTLDKIFQNARKNIYLEYQSIGKSVEGRDFHFVIMAKDKKSVNDYLNKTVPNKLNNPKELQDKLKNKTIGDYKVPIFINNIHPNEAPGIDAQLDALQKLTTEKVIKYNTMKNGKEVPTELDVDNLLDNVIILMNLTENPDGRYYNRRENNNGFDINRDNCYQTQPESRNVISQIVKWNPITFIDLHGFVKEFLIEPCTPPHDPNYEYDLLAPLMLEQAHALGDAGIANTKFDSYIIPMKDYKYGWDDGGPAYTPVYAMHHGVFGHTVETPELNQAGCDNQMYGLFGVANYVLHNKDKLFEKQLEYYRRGIEGRDEKSVDEWFVNQAGQAIGRPRGENKNFFPEYYVLPVDKKLQKNPLEVYNMVQYLLRNGIKVERTNEDISVNGVTYPKGTFIVNMHQAKRGLANTVLYHGTDVSDFENMYAEVVVDFPDLRGFDRYEVRVPNAFNGKVQNISSINKPVTIINKQTEKQIIKNSNNEVIRVINELLNEGKEVNVILESGAGYNKGDYIVNTKDIEGLGNKYFVESIPVSKNIQVEKLVQPKVYNAGSKQSTYILKRLGFKLVNDPKLCDVMVDDEGHTEGKDVILNGKDYVGIGQWALGFIKDNNLIPGFNFGYTDKYGCHEGLLKGTLNTDNIINSGYKKDDTIYTANGAWISEVPEKATVLSKINNDDKFYVSGWWPNHNKAKGQVMAMTQPIGNSRVTLFANTITNKDHPQHNYRQMANAIFASVYNPDAKVLKPEVLEPKINILGVDNDKVYDKAVKPVIEVPDKSEYTVELDGKPWDGKEITKEGKHKLIVKTKDPNGNEKIKEINFEIKYPNKNDAKPSDGDKDNNNQQLNKPTNNTNTDGNVSTNEVTSQNNDSNTMNGNEVNGQTNNNTPEVNGGEVVGVDPQVSTDSKNVNEQQEDGSDLPTTGSVRTLEYIMAMGAILIIIGLCTMFIRKRKTKVN